MLAAATLRRRRLPAQLRSVMLAVAVDRLPTASVAAITAETLSFVALARRLRAALESLSDTVTDRAPAIVLLPRATVLRPSRRATLTLQRVSPAGQLSRRPNLPDFETRKPSNVRVARGLP
jgi:hypothetical protein